MIRRSTRPLTSAERADLERPIVETYALHPAILFMAFLLLVGVLAGIGLGIVCAMCISVAHSLGGTARVVVTVLSIAGFAPAGWLAYVGARGLWSIRPHRPRVRRAARTLSNAAAEVLEIPVERAWRLDLGDEDSPLPLVIQTPDQNYVYLRSDGLDSLYESLDEGGRTTPMLGPTVTISRFEGNDLSITTGEGSLVIEDIDLTQDSRGASVWSALDELRPDVEVREHDIPRVLLECLGQSKSVGRTGQAPSEPDARRPAP